VAESIARPYAHRLAGRLASTSYDRATGELAVTWLETGVSAATEVVVPRELFADVGVTSDDPPGSWSFEHRVAEGRLLLYVDHARSEHAFRIAPR
jgi:hypothetical protein